jgi:hypothetical protein
MSERFYTKMPDRAPGIIAEPRTLSRAECVKMILATPKLEWLAPCFLSERDEFDRARLGRRLAKRKSR